MPIAQLGFEGRYPVFTWATKPAANAVPVGTRITIIGWMAPPSDWVSDGTYWLPVGGRAVVHAPVLVDAQATGATVQSLVASVPTWQVPANMASTPGMYIEAVLTAEVVSGVSADQQRQIYIGIESSKNLLGVHVFTSTTLGKRFWGRTYRNNSPAEWMSFTGNAQMLVDTNSITARATDAQLAADPIGVYYQGGAADGSEIIKFHSFGLAVGVGA